MAAQLHPQWRKITESETLRRSSQIVAAIDGTAYVFGGELRPREPRDNDLHLIKFLEEPELGSVTAIPAVSSDSAPSPRVGAAATTLNGKLYIFGGRGGVAMSPIEEHGSLWAFDPTAKTWERVSPKTPAQPYPEARSYHAITNDGSAILYVHAGCPEQGRLNDLWSFDVHSREWERHPSAPGSPRGGSSITFYDDRLFRANGFDGEKEIGGALDVYDRGTWTTHNYPTDGKSGPEARSVAALIYFKIRNRPSLVTFFGERGPSTLGHAGAGKMLSDIWVWDLLDKTWSELHVEGNKPSTRGWFGAAKVDGEAGILVQGGLGETNERLGDLWLLEFV